MNDSHEFNVRLNVDGSLCFFLRDKAHNSLGKTLREKTSVKDFIESCGVPHTELDLILIDGRPVDFAFLLSREHEIDIFGVGAVPRRFECSRLQRRGVRHFIADGHLGKLVRFLRLLGIDVIYRRMADDRELTQISATEERALLTRDRRLLMHAIVRDGYYPRSQDAETQTLEVVRRFRLQEMFAPYTRCLDCNGLLDSVPKDQVLTQLEPLTKIYYEDFRRCTDCGKIYWAGSHFSKLEARIAQLLGQLQTSPACD